MKIRLFCLLALLGVTSSTSAITKREDGKKLDTLISIFKTNPLKESSVFEKFSNAILMKDKNGSLDMPPGEFRKPNEYAPSKALVDIEKSIHSSKSHPKHVKFVKPDYSVQATAPEKFSGTIIMRGAISDYDFNKVDKDNITDNKMQNKTLLLDRIDEKLLNGKFSNLLIFDGNEVGNNNGIPDELNDLRKDVVILL